MKIRPTEGRVLVLPQENEIKSASGLFLGSNTNDKTQRGTIIALHEDNLNMLAGDTVIFQKGYGIELNIDGVDYLMLHENDILATF
jgi:chaperonin GroES